MLSKENMIVCLLTQNNFRQATGYRLQAAGLKLVAIAIVLMIVGGTLSKENRIV